LYWQVMHHAAVKSTNTAWPLLISFFTRSTLQGCQRSVA
jgi:hypothetical protein